MRVCESARAPVQCVRVCVVCMRGARACVHAVVRVCMCVRTRVCVRVVRERARAPENLRILFERFSIIFLPSISMHLSTYHFYAVHANRTILSSIALGAPQLDPNNDHDERIVTN